MSVDILLPVVHEVLSRNMNISKISFILLHLQILGIFALNISLKTWQLQFKRGKKTIEEGIKEYFERRTYLLSVGIHLEHFQQWQFYINDYLTNVLKNTESMSFEIFIDHGGVERKTKVFYHNVWYVDSHKAFRALLPAIENNYVETMGQYMVIMDAAQHLQTDYEIQLIFKTAFEWNIVDIAVAIYMGKSTFNLYTYDVFLPQQCRQPITRHFNVFKGGHFASEELFPHKLRNFQKCPIEMHIRSAVPFFSYNTTEDGKAIAHYEGLEARIVHTMSEELNFAINFKIWTTEEVGNVYENGTATGAFLMLRHKEVDMLIGYYHNPTRYRYFAVSTPYFLTPFVVVIRKRKRRAADGMWLMEPFDRYVWLMMFLTTAIGMALVSLLHYILNGQGNFPVPVTWLDMFGLALGNYGGYECRYYTTKYGFIMWTFGYMILCAIYGGELYGAFQWEPKSGPLTIAELVKANYTFLLKPYLNTDLIKNLGIPRHQMQYNFSRIDEIVFEDMLHDTRDMALLTNYWQFKAYLVAHKLFGEYEIVPNAVPMNQLCAYMRPQSFFLGPFNHLMQSFSSVGLFEKWMMDVSNVYGGLNDQTAETTSEPKPLSFRKVRMIFVGLLVLHVLAFVVLIGEIFVHEVTGEIDSI